MFKSFFTFFQSSFFRDWLSINIFRRNRYIMFISLIVLIVSLTGRAVIAEPSVFKGFSFVLGGQSHAEFFNSSLESCKFGFQKKANMDRVFRPVCRVGVNASNLVDNGFSEFLRGVSKSIPFVIKT